MAYRTGNHWGVTIVREGERTPEGHITGADELVAVVTNGDTALADRICALLDADDARLALIEETRPKVYHQAEIRGSDSLGYGHCLECGEMWPCATYRGERP